MNILTLDAHEQVDVADILVALDNSCDKKAAVVVLYAIGKFIAKQFEDDLPDRLVAFLNDLNTVALTCHAFPTSSPPERPMQ